MLENELLENELFNYKLDFDAERRVITGRDYNDSNNLPTFFTQKIRGIEKAFEELKKNYKSMTFNEVVRYLDDKKLKVHYYCAMD